MCEDSNVADLGHEINKAISEAWQKAVSNMNAYYLEHKDEIDAKVKKEKVRLRNMRRNRPKIERGDIVRILTCHSAELLCYQVAGFDNDGVYSQPAHFCHRNDEIIAIYRFDGKDYKCIWERSDYKKYKKEEAKNDTGAQGD